MRVFTLFLMLAVAVIGGLGSYRLITGRDLVSLYNLGILPQASEVVATPTATPSSTGTPQPTAQPTAAPATPTPAATATSTVMVVGNTDGKGVYVRKTPQMGDRLRAWVDGTKMEVLGPPLDGEGMKWLKVRAPDGSEGYIPEKYLKTP